MESVFQDCIAEVKKAGKTVLLSSHILAEVEKLCDKIGIIRDGRLVESGSLDKMRHLTRTSVTVDTGKPVNGLDQLSGVHNLRVEGNRAIFQVDTDSLDETLKYLAQFQIMALTSAPPTLGELFMRHYGDKVV